MKEIRMPSVKQLGRRVLMDGMYLSGIVGLGTTGLAILDNSTQDVDRNYYQTLSETETSIPYGPDHLQENHEYAIEKIRQADASTERNINLIIGGIILAIAPTFYEGRKLVINIENKIGY